jgi:hypothetical protein
MSPEQIGCETCLKLQKEYADALRLYADAVDQRTETLTQGNHASDRAAIAAVNSADWVCAEARLSVERHESRAHPKAKSAIR